MPFDFPTVLSSTQTNPAGRFPTPGPDATFHWWKWATPAPAYVICVVKITYIYSADLIKVRFFTRDGQLDSTEVDIDLADQDAAWRTLPSTIGALPASVSALGTDDCAVLCVTPALLAKAPGIDATTFRKYPYAEDSDLIFRQQIELMREAIADMAKKLAPATLSALASYNRLVKAMPELP